MADFFYIDANGVKQGPFGAEHLKELAAQGIIGLDTRMETKDGNAIPNFRARQIFGADFDSRRANHSGAVPSPSPSTRFRKR